MNREKEGGRIDFPLFGTLQKREGKKVCAGSHSHIKNVSSTGRKAINKGPIFCSCFLTKRSYFLLKMTKLSLFFQLNSFSIIKILSKLAKWVIFVV